MTDLRMVPVVRVSHGFEARVVAARLGSEGIVTQFRGAVEGPYPVGAVEVLVAEADVADARDILAAEEVPPEIGDGAEAPIADQAPSRTPIVVVTLVLVLVALTFVTAVGGGMAR